MTLVFISFWVNWFILRYSFLKKSKQNRTAMCSHKNKNEKKAKRLFAIHSTCSEPPGLVVTNKCRTVAFVPVSVEGSCAERWIRKGRETTRRNLGNVATLIHEIGTGGEGGRKHCRRFECGQLECGKNEPNIS